MILINEEGRQQGLASRDQALFLAYEKGFDLVMLNEKSNPPIAKLMDYGKYVYSQEKQISKQKAKVKDVELKEIRMGIKISEHDMNVKINQAKKFLEIGDKVKLTIQLRGREMMFRDKVQPLLNKIISEAGGVLEKPTERLGTRFSVIITKAKNESKNS